MPKSKQQKQAEAQERLRSLIPGRRDTMFLFQPGGEQYKWTLKIEGRQQADKEAQEEMKRFKAFCAAANVDTNGNPL